jgi:DNA-binding GntR family transcriptional regulator
MRSSIDIARVPTRDVPRHGARGAHVYSKLRDAIQKGELKPGQRIMEVEVADWLRVSRTPVRDAGGDGTVCNA